MKPLVLLSNDDGYRSRGLNLMRQALAQVAEVVVCAPNTQQSASSHSLTLHRPLRLKRREEGVYSVDGTPADCVYVAVHSGDRVLPRRPDLVVSGMNHGVNLGDDVFYSGTVAAAREGALKGIASLAVSAAPEADMMSAAALGAQIARSMLIEPLAAPILLNVNFPAGSEWPVRATRLGTRRYLSSIEFRHDPRGREYLWIGGQGIEHDSHDDSDTQAFEAGDVGVTPLVLDLWGRTQQPVTEEIVTRVKTLIGAD